MVYQLSAQLAEENKHINNEDIHSEDTMKSSPESSRIAWEKHERCAKSLS